MAVLIFKPPLGVLKRYDVHFWLIGKRVVDFLLVNFLSLGVMTEAPRENIDWKSVTLLERDQFGPKFQVQGLVPHKSFFLSQN